MSLPFNLSPQVLVTVTESLTNTASGTDAVHVNMGTQRSHAPCHLQDGAVELLVGTSQPPPGEA